MTNYATLDDLTTLVRELDSTETEKATLLLEAASARLRLEAKKRGRDLDAMLEDDPDLVPVARQIVCDMIRRALAVNVNQEPMQQVSQSALGYSVSATYAVPGGSLYAMTSELKALGLLKARFGHFDPYEAVSADAES